MAGVTLITELSLEFSVSGIRTCHYLQGTFSGESPSQDRAASKCVLFWMNQSSVSWSFSFVFIDPGLYLGTLVISQELPDFAGKLVCFPMKQFVLICGEDFPERNSKILKRMRLSR